MRSKRSWAAAFAYRLAVVFIFFGIFANSLSAAVSNLVLLDAQKLMMAQKWKEAETLFRNDLKKSEKSQIFWQGFTTTLVHLDKRSEAVRFLTEYSSRLNGGARKWALERIRIISRLFIKSTTQQLYQDGVNLMAVENYRLAKDKLFEAYGEEKDNAEILVRLGQCHLLDQQFELGLTYLMQAKSLVINDPQISLWLGRAYLLNRRLTEAQLELNIASVELRGSPWVPLWLAETHIQMGSVPIALRILENDFQQWPLHIGSLILSVQLRLDQHLTEHKILTHSLQALKTALLDPAQYDHPVNSFDLDVVLRQSDRRWVKSAETLMTKSLEQ